MKIKTKQKETAASHNSITFGEITIKTRKYQTKTRIEMIVV